MTPENLDKWKIVPRLMMLVMTGVYIRCIEWALSQPELSTQEADPNIGRHGGNDRKSGTVSKCRKAKG